jgi:hypothetical protein
VLSCAAPLVYWDYFIEDQGLRTLFEVVGVMAHIPGCPAVLGGSMLADEWARSPLTVSMVSRGLDGDEAKALSTPRTIPGMDLEWPLRFLLWYKWRGARCQSPPPPLAISIFSELEQKHPSLPLILKLAPRSITCDG